MYVALAGWLEAKLPLDVREEVRGSLYFTPLVLPSTDVKADVFLHCLTSLVMGAIVQSRPGGNLWFSHWVLEFGV